MDNKDLQSKYNEMHKHGAGAWFSDGREERETILKIGEPWHYDRVLEIGCGEGDLSLAMAKLGCFVTGIDYSEKAIDKAVKKLTRTVNDKYDLHFHKFNYRSVPINPGFQRIVMQGVLEHLDDPFGELQWMIEHFKPRTVITSSPCFLNTRGIVWMTLDMLGAVMSKTDLHYLDPNEFEDFCDIHNYSLRRMDCDFSWGNYDAMVQDLKTRIPLALKDGGLPEAKHLYHFLKWLNDYPFRGLGATMVYRIDV